MATFVSPERHDDGAVRVAPLPTTPLAGGAVSEPAIRIAAVLGVCGIAIIHLINAPGTFDEARYMFWLYIAIAAGAVPVSIALLVWDSPLVWLGAAGLAAGPLLGYILSRTIGLPQDADDVGNWLETLGLVSLFAEAGVLSLALVRLAPVAARLRG